MHRRARLLAATLACGAAFTGVFTAVSPTALAAAGSGSVRAGENASLTIAFPGTAAECQLTAWAAGRAPVTLSRVRPTGSRVTWLWHVPAGARTATWGLVAMCGANHLGAIVRVQGRAGAGALSLARGMQALQYVGATSRLQSSSVRAAARMWWASNSASILAGFHSGTSTGECTSYVAARRPDIVERVDVWAYARWLHAGHGTLGVNWDAMYWAANARRAGMATGHTPRVGAVIVFQHGAYGATALGHVAYVSSVGRDGSFTITEMHAPVRGRVSARHFDAATARAMATNPGIAFIY